MARSQSLDTQAGFAPSGPARPFGSILFPDRIVDVSAFAEPAFFSDLNLDQAVDAITAGAQEYELKPFFHGARLLPPLREPRDRA